MQIIQPVQVKVILTENTRQLMQQDYHKQRGQIALELEQLKFEGKKLLHQRDKLPAQEHQELIQRIHKEEQKRKQQLEEILFQLEQLEKLADGTEINVKKVHRLVNLAVGDIWDDDLDEAAIVLKDGKVHEIREGRGSSDE